jgi:ABC-type nitrate/sulfonate/bicarbonate transport system ATPase subunit
MTFGRGAGTSEVLRDVSLRVAKGEYVSIIGHSGCGKSTLVRALGGLLKLDAGSIRLDGKEITGPGPDRAMVFQHYSLLPRLSLVSNVRAAVRSARPEKSKAAADEAAGASQPGSTGVPPESGPGTAYRE